MRRRRRTRRVQGRRFGCDGGSCARSFRLAGVSIACGRRAVPPPIPFTWGRDRNVQCAGGEGGLHSTGARVRARTQGGQFVILARHPGETRAAIKDDSRRRRRVEDSVLRRGLPHLCRASCASGRWRGASLVERNLDEGRSRARNPQRPCGPRTGRTERGRLWRGGCAPLVSAPGGSRKRTFRQKFFHPLFHDTSHLGG